MSKFGIGNTYGNETLEWSNGQKRVWREIRHQYPAGGTFSTTDLESYKGKVIPAGTPVVFDQSTKELTLANTTSATAVDGFTQEDVYVKDGVTAASATVIYDGEIYEPVLKAVLTDAVLAVIKPLAPATIKFVQ